MLGLNGWPINRMRPGLIDGFGVPGENVNRRRVSDFSTERESCMDNTHFEYKSWNK